MESLSAHGQLNMVEITAYKWNKILPRHIDQTGNMFGLETRDVLEQVLTEVPRVLDHVYSLFATRFSSSRF